MRGAFLVVVVLGSLMVAPSQAADVTSGLNRSYAAIPGGPQYAVGYSSYSPNIPWSSAWMGCEPPLPVRYYHGFYCRGHVQMHHARTYTY